MKKQVKNLALALSIISLIPFPLMAQDLEAGKKIYATCVQCHGENGLGLVEKEAPRIAGQHDWYIVTQLKNFKSKQRSNPAMYPFIQGLSEKEMQDVAGYLSQLKTK